MPNLKQDENAEILLVQEFLEEAAFFWIYSTRPFAINTENMFSAIVGLYSFLLC